jgi:hypothetical protein
MLARLLLRHGVSFHAFADLAKRAYVEAAHGDFGIPGRKPSISRVAVLTGLTRKEIQKLIDSASAPDTEASERYNRAARVVTGWVRDKDFCDADGQPVALLTAPRPASRNGPPQQRRHPLGPCSAIAARWHRQETPDGHIRLVARAYIPHQRPRQARDPQFRRLRQSTPSIWPASGR